MKGRAGKIRKQMLKEQQRQQVKSWLDDPEKEEVFCGKSDTFKMGKGCDMHPQYKGDLFVFHTSSTKLPLLMCVTFCAPRVLHKLLREYQKFYTALWGPLESSEGRTAWEAAQQVIDAEPVVAPIS